MVSVYYPVGILTKNLTSVLKHASGYAIGGILSQLDEDTGHWLLISAERLYETHDAELLTIIEAFKTWLHYLEGSRHKVLVLTDHNNLRRFMDTKKPSPRQVRWAH